MTDDGRFPRRHRLRAEGAPALPLLLLALALPAHAQAPGGPEGYAPLRGLFSMSADERRAAARGLIESRDASLVPGLVDALFFLPKPRRAEALSALEALAGERAGDRYHDWVELVARRPGLRPREGYAEWKGELFARIDPRYREILRGGTPAAPARIRLEEIVWGGVPLEGIPALDRPRSVPAGQAGYLQDGEQVFGVSLGGERRAYPLRILGWHEMLNDEVGGEPVTLSYCTLCGSGVLFGTRRQGGEPFTFGTSGLLYRSNKLMVDRQTGTLWSNLTGEPVLGELARDPEGLPVLPLTLTTWKDWRTRHPDTTVLALDRRLAERWGYDYSPGAADRKRRGVSFPGGPGGPGKPAGAGLDGKAEIFAVRLRGLAKAYPVDVVLRERVVNDRLGENPLVLVGDSQSGAVRAYRSGGRTFVPGSRLDELVDGTGVRWVALEEGLAPAGPEAFAPLERIPGHQAFWFGWYSFFPESELYRGQAAPAGE